MKKILFLGKLRKIISKLEEIQFEKNSSINEFSSSEQIKSFKEKLLSIENDVANGNIPPANERTLGIAKVVVDQWPFDFYLSEWLVEIEYLYKNYK